eukprot:gene4832-biopygen9833
MFLELNVRWSLAPSGNSWWRQFCGWKNKKEADKDRLVKLVKGRHARTRHSIKKGRGVQGVTILGAINEAAGDRMREDDPTTYKEYFKKEYHMDLDPEGPVLKCRFAGTRKLVMYPAEVLQPLFVFDIQSINVQLCSMYPADRFRHIKDVLERAKKNDIGKYLESYGLSFTPSMVMMKVNTSRNVLPCPIIYFPSGTKLDSKKYPEQLGFIKELMNSANVRHEGKNLPQLMCTSNPQAVIDSLNGIGLGMKVGKGDIRRVADNSVYVVGMRGNQTPEYKDAKMACGTKGVVSQCYWRPLQAIIPKMIALQIAAKLGYFNFRIDLQAVAPSFAPSNTSNVLIVGVDVGPPARTRPARLLTCVAFYVKGGNQWETRCDHTWVDTRNKANQDISVPRINEALKKFLEATAKYYNVATSTGTLLLCRSPASSGELPMCFHWAGLCTSIFGKWNVCVVGSQSRGDTKLAWDTHGQGNTADFRNVPRGLCIDDSMTIPVTLNGEQTYQVFRGFRLCGANCVLGQANTLLYLVFELGGKLTMKDLQQLLYALCYMYPNMPGALPMPLPIKAATEYNKKYNSLPDLKKLHEKMRSTMHYL